MSASDNDPTGDLLIQEVDEELRREHYHRLWKRYGNHVIAAALAIVLIVAGYQGWQTWQAKQRQEEAAKFNAAQELIAQGKTDEGMAALNKVAAESRSGFAVVAGMQSAAAAAAKGDAAAASAAYERIASSDAPKTLRELAVLKEALLTVDSADPAQLEKRVAPLAEAGSPWHYTASEVLALIARKKGDTKQAVDLYKQLADDLQAPQGVRARAAEMLTLLTPAAATPAAPAPAAPAGDKAKG